MRMLGCRKDHWHQSQRRSNKSRSFPPCALSAGSTINLTPWTALIVTTVSTSGVTPCHGCLEPSIQNIIEYGPTNWINVIFRIRVSRPFHWLSQHMLSSLSVYFSLSKNTSPDETQKNQKKKSFLTRSQFILSCNSGKCASENQIIVEIHRGWAFRQQSGRFQLNVHLVPADSPPDKRYSDLGVSSDALLCETVLVIQPHKTMAWPFFIKFTCSHASAAFRLTLPHGEVRTGNCQSAASCLSPVINPFLTISNQNLLHPSHIHPHSDRIFLSDGPWALGLPLFA